MKAIIILSKISLLLGSVLLVSCVSEPVVSLTAPVRSQSDALKVAPAKRMLAGQGPGCDGSVEPSQAERVSVVNEVVANAEKELVTNPNVLSDNESRARVGTFAAGTMSDTVPFVSVDRECWASFYEAQNALIAGKEDEAAAASKDWEVCLRANYPARVAIAQPYFSCFAKPTAKLGK